MFRALYDNVHTVCWIFASLMLLCALLYFIVGVIIKIHGIPLKLLLIGEECVFATVSSIIIFLTFSLPAALAVWLLICFLMYFIFRNNRRLISCIVYYEQNKAALSSRQLRMFSKLNPCVTSTHITSWIKDFQRLRREMLYKLESDAHSNRLKQKRKILPFSFFASGTLGLFVTLFTYGDLIDHSNSFLILLLENYTLLSCVLYVLYWLFYFSSVANRFHTMYGHKRLFMILFAAFSILMYVGVTVISMNG